MASPVEAPTSSADEAVGAVSTLRSRQRVEVNIAAAPILQQVFGVPSGALAAALDGSFVGDLAH